MQRVAVLVDAGHLFAQGSAAIAGSSQPRQQIKINPGKVIEAIREQCALRAEGCSLLRVYWYDGVGVRGPSQDHERLSLSDNIKLRLGFINSQGQQKGVDSLIVTDLIELARNGAISDAILLAGDEDLRIGVQVAQSYGVRVHLLGIAPSRASQSKQLMAEADTTHEWTKEEISQFLTVNPGLSTKLTMQSESPVTITENAVVVPQLKSGESPPTIEQCAIDFCAALSEVDLKSTRDHFQTDDSLPKILDSKLLGSTRDRIGRALSNVERAQMRASFRLAVSIKPLDA